MMRTGSGRNDPCPCGSGKKYKHCCRLGEDDVRSVHQVMRSAAAEKRVWAADAVPLLIRIDEAEAHRPVALLVTAGVVVIHHDLRGRLGGEIADVAAALEQAVVGTARQFGAFPETVRVRHAAVADALAPLLASREVAVETGAVPDLEAAARGMQSALAGGELWPPVSRPETWAAWDLPRPTIASVFEAAAGFYRSAPWKDVENLQAPRAVLPSGRSWTCCVLGSAGEEFGLALYSDAADLFEGVAMQRDDELFDRVRGQIVSVVFNSARDAGPRALREAKASRWEVAGPSAFPLLITVNTPGGGASRADVADLIALLGAIPDFVRHHRNALLREERTGEPIRRIEWVHPHSGIAFTYEGEAARFDRRLAEENESDDPAALGQDLEHTLAAYNSAPQAELGGLSPEEARRLLESDWLEPDGAVRLRDDLALADLTHCDLLADAQALLALAADRGELGATPAGNLKLSIVAELLAHLKLDGFLSEAGGVLGKRVTEQDVWPLHQLRVVCECAGLLRKRAQRFVPTALARTLLGSDACGALYARLFHTWFRRFNIGYGKRMNWPELQPQVAYTLYRLPDVAGEWCSAGELLPRVVLPYALSRAPVSASIELAPIILEVDVLDPLVRFGLLERTPRARGPRIADDRRYRVTSLARSFVRFDV